MGSGGAVSSAPVDFSPISDVASSTASAPEDRASWEKIGEEERNDALL